MGTICVDRLGRRKVLVIGTLLCAITLACAMGCSAASKVATTSNGSVKLDASKVNRAASKASIAFLILFGGAFAWGYQPLLPIYPSEVLRMEQRSTGMGLVVLSLNLCSE